MGKGDVYVPAEVHLLQCVSDTLTLPTVTYCRDTLMVHTKFEDVLHCDINLKSVNSIKHILTKYVANLKHLDKKRIELKHVIHMIQDQKIPKGNDCVLNTTSLKLGLSFQLNQTPVDNKYKSYAYLAAKAKEAGDSILRLGVWYCVNNLGEFAASNPLQSNSIQPCSVPSQVYLEMDSCHRPQGKWFEYDIDMSNFTTLQQSLKAIISKEKTIQRKYITIMTVVQFWKMPIGIKKRFLRNNADVQKAVSDIPESIHHCVQLAVDWKVLEKLTKPLMIWDITKVRVTLYTDLNDENLPKHSAVPFHVPLNMSSLQTCMDTLKTFITAHFSVPPEHVRNIKVVHYVVVHTCSADALKITQHVTTDEGLRDIVSNYNADDVILGITWDLTMNNRSTLSLHNVVQNNQLMGPSTDQQRPINIKHSAECCATIHSTNVLPFNGRPSLISIRPVNSKDKSCKSAIERTDMKYTDSVPLSENTKTCEPNLGDKANFVVQNVDDYEGRRLIKEDEEAIALVKEGNEDILVKEEEDVVNEDTDDEVILEEEDEDISLVMDNNKMTLAKKVNMTWHNEEDEISTTLTLQDGTVTQEHVEASNQAPAEMINRYVSFIS